MDTRYKVLKDYTLSCCKTPVTQYINKEFNTVLWFGCCTSICALGIPSTWMECSTLEWMICNVLKFLLWIFYCWQKFEIDFFFSLGVIIYGPIEKILNIFVDKAGLLALYRSCMQRLECKGFIDKTQYL